MATLRAQPSIHFLKQVILNGQPPGGVPRGFGRLSNEVREILQAVRPWIGDAVDHVVSLEAERERA